MVTTLQAIVLAGEIMLGPLTEEQSRYEEALYEYLCNGAIEVNLP